MQRLEVSGAVRLIYVSLGVKRLITVTVGAVRYTEQYICQGCELCYSVSFGLHFS